MQIEDFIKKCCAESYMSPEILWAIIRSRTMQDPSFFRYNPNLPVWDLKAASYRAGVTQLTENFLQQCCIGITGLPGYGARIMGYQHSLIGLLDPEVCIEYSARWLRYCYNNAEKNLDTTIINFELNQSPEQYKKTLVALAVNNTWACQAE